MTMLFLGLVVAANVIALAFAGLNWRRKDKEERAKRGMPRIVVNNARRFLF